MSRKKKVEEPAQPATPEAAAPAAPPRAGLPAWLDTMTCTRPFTVDDCLTLKEMIKRDMPAGFIFDVVYDETYVHIFAYATRDTFIATYTRDMELK